MTQQQQQQPQQHQEDEEIFAMIAEYPTLLNHEESLLKTPYDLKAWWLYLEDIDTLLQGFTSHASSNSRSNKKKTTTHPKQKQQKQQQQELLLEKLREFVGRRSVAALPGSYKLWKCHWEFLLGQNAKSRPGFDNYTRILQAMETALRTLHKCPRVWLVYLQFVLSLPNQELLKVPEECLTTSNSSGSGTTTLMMTKTTFLRTLANRALQALPVTQHEDKLWPVLLECWKDDTELQDFEAELGDLLNDGSNMNDQDPTTTSTTTEQEESAVETQLRVETRCRLLRRYVMLQPTYRATLCDFYRDHEKWGEAALLYQEMLQNPNSASKSSRETPEYFQWWNALADLCTQHPVEVEEAGVPWEAMVRSAVAIGSNHTTTTAPNNNTDTGTEGSSSLGMATTTISVTNSAHATVLQEMQGLLWSKLADSWIRRGEFDLARSVLEEGLESVSRVRDFTILFDAYLQFEQGLLEAAAEQMEEDGDVADEDGSNSNDVDDDDWDILLGSTKAIGQDGTGKAGQSMADLELAMARAEHLTSRRPILLNRVLLRQNPHNVGEWIARSKLYEEQEEPIMAASALEEALKTVQATRANNGTPSSLVTELVKLYESQSVEKARDFLERICVQQEYAFKTSDELAECYAAWVELELRHEAWDDALAIVRGAVAPVSRQTSNSGGRVLKLTKSLRLWDLLLDLEESLGTTQTTKDAYNRSIEIKVATPLHILNFASFLTGHKYFEESFSVFERGLELFAFPHPGAKILWKAYIEAFNKRFSGTKIERTRDIFQRCLETCPAEECAEFFMMNGAFEEEYGLTKRALGVYGAMARKVPKDDKFTAYQLYIAKTTRYLGLTATREIYQEAIEALEDDAAAKLCLDFAKMETTLQEIERSRAVLTYGAQMADPRRNPEYWKTWNEFEIAHGNEETFREMLRIKRGVEAAFSTVNYNAAEMGAGGKVENLSNEDAMNMIASREGVDVGSNQQSNITGFVKAGKRSAEVDNLDEVEERVAKLRKATATSNATGAAATDDGGDDEEIDIDDVDEDEDEEEQDESQAQETVKTAVKDVSTKAVPAAVFGGLAGTQGEGNSSKKGALERLRAAAKGT